MNRVVTHIKYLLFSVFAKTFFEVAIQLFDEKLRQLHSVATKPFYSRSVTKKEKKKTVEHLYKYNAHKLFIKMLTFKRCKPLTHFELKSKNHVDQLACVWWRKIIERNMLIFFLLFCRVDSNWVLHIIWHIRVVPWHTKHALFVCVLRQWIKFRSPPLLYFLPFYSLYAVVCLLIFLWPPHTPVFCCVRIFFFHTQFKRFGSQCRREIVW